MKLYIKNMVCQRCRMHVEKTLELLKLKYNSVTIGEADLTKDISKKQLIQFKAALLPSGLEVIEDSKQLLISKIKDIIVDIAYHSDEPLVTNFSEHLSTRLDYDYTYLANIFSKAEGVTIEQTLISHRIERAKELLKDDELDLTEIAYRLHYSSVSHLSSQFKRVVGITPSAFKKNHIHYNH